jgi:hypothetical protein
MRYDNMKKKDEMKNNINLDLKCNYNVLYFVPCEKILFYILYMLFM